jgi:hypothetical protein
VVVRLLGVSLIVACAALVYMLYGHVHSPPLHQAGVGEVLLALAAVVTGLPGVLMLVAGDKLIIPPE